MTIPMLPWGTILSQAELRSGPLQFDGTCMVYVRRTAQVRRQAPGERVLEIPLALAHAALDQPGIVLDAGGGLTGWNLDVPNLQAQLVHVEQALGRAEVLAPSGTHVSFVSADLRDLSWMSTGGFDRAVCISTLEHIGLDNTAYGAHMEHHPASMMDAVRELLRVTHGSVLITVPFDERGLVTRKARPYAAEWRQFTSHDVQEIARCADVARRVVENCYYHTDGDGWYGGEHWPRLDLPHPEPGVVNQIACIRIAGL